MRLQIKQDLFRETNHSPSLIDLVGFEAAEQVIDYCFIANPYYPTAAMIAELTEKLPRLIKYYPSSNPMQNNRHLAAVLHVDPENLIIGNGATELITSICDTLIDTIGLPIPTFGEYLGKIERRKVALYPLAADKDYQLDLDAYLAWLKEQGVNAAVVINPNNPTGQTFSVAEMHTFLQKAKGLDLVIVDESFIDFAAEEIPSLLHSAEHYSNLIIVRSMSKHCGVPGLRLGYCYTDNRYLLNRLRRTLPTWNINTLAEYYLSQLPGTDADYHEARLRVIQDVRWLGEQLRQLPGLYVYPTGANFVLVRLENGRTAHDLQMHLLQEYQLYVRDCSNKLGMDLFHIRIASQGRTKDEPLVAALKEVLSAEF